MPQQSHIHRQHLKGLLHTPPGLPNTLSFHRRAHFSSFHTPSWDTAIQGGPSLLPSHGSRGPSPLSHGSPN
ncbi:hypothetical protein E2C01_088594 [Portunus trituberculatus]|uniref:Uncharacterized protein n=1 Tax=Portunus trituberculatus TaxID=210409 RepID=A0A5B7JH01_PORTR|nr:hypothetical protein [Portunus trituberculatus]